MLRNDLQSLISRAVAAQVSAGTLPAVLADFRPEISDTKQPEHGDFACNLAMVASKAAGMNPRQLGEALRAAILATDGGNTLDDVEVAGPGFLNLRLKPTAIAAYVPTAIELGTEKLAQVPQPQGKKINVEFVSVNPNGPITIGSGRGAAFGSALCNVLAAAGNEVHREYYINDGVNSEQMRLFAESVAAILRGEPVPDNGYKGDYVKRVALNLALDMFNATIDPANRRQATDQILPYVLLDGAIGRYLFSDQTEDEIWELIELAPKIHAYLDPQIRDVLRVAGQIRQYANDIPQIARALYPGIETTARILSITSLVIADALASGGQLPTYVKHNHVIRLLPTYNAMLTSAVLYKDRPGWEFFQASNGLKELADSFESNHARRERRLWLEDILAEGGKLPIIGELDIETVKARAEDAMILAQRRDLHKFGVTFDTWFSEQSLHDSGVVAQRLDELTAKGVADDQPFRTKVKIVKGKIEETEIEPQESVKDEDDAEGSGKTLWLRSTKFGDDQDRVLRRRDGRLTYISSDVAYHADKFNRPANADKLITVLGPDHHGYIGRLNAVVAALLQTADQTDEEATATAREKLEVVIFQVVRFLKEGKPAPMRKRDGNIYALIDLINEIGQSTAPNADAEEQQRIGRDVTRFFYLMRSHDTAMDFDLDLAARQSDENPVFYAQYAHARICSVLARAGEIESGTADHALLVHPREGLLIKKILDLPWEVERSARDYGVHRLTTYVVELARLFHHFYDACRVVQPEQPELSRARLDLCRLTKNALQAALDLLGISAPERMERTAQEAPTL